MLNRIVLNIVTKNRLHRMWEHVLIAKEYFDEVRIFDLGNDGTKEFCKLHNVTHIPCESKISVVEDGFKKILEYANDGEWVSIIDSDECFTRDFLRNIRRMVEESDDGNNYNVISTIPIDLNLDGGISDTYEDKINQQLKIPLADAFKKEVLFKYYDSESFEGTSHHGLCGVERKPLYVYYGYYHNRTIKEVCESVVFFTFADIISNDLRFTKTHFSSKEISYLKNLFKRKKIDTIDKFHKFWDVGKFTKTFSKFCEDCFEVKSDDHCDNGNVVSQRMGWFLYMFIYNKPELMPEQYKEFFSDYWFYKR